MVSIILALGDLCESPPDVPHGAVVGEKDGDYFRPYDEAEVLCRPGYKYKGTSQFILCEEEGEWEEQFGECIGNTSESLSAFFFYMKVSKLRLNQNYRLQYNVPQRIFFFTLRKK